MAGSLYFAKSLIEKLEWVIPIFENIVDATFSSQDFPVNFSPTTPCNKYIKLLYCHTCLSSADGSMY